MNTTPARAAGGFDRLDPRIQKWIWEKGWTRLRDAQERAIEPLLAGDRDVIVAAATAAGKTEAAFLPILTHLLRRPGSLGQVTYCSPLKSLINDQWGRLETLCETLEVPVTAWHGDAAAAQKKRFLKDPSGVLLITPESLEALFVRRGTQIRRVFADVTHIVIDELHAFIGTPRGRQMQSLLSRIEQAVGRRIPRVGLSATLGDMHLAADYLRPGAGAEVVMVVSGPSDGELLIQLRGYEIAAPGPNPTRKQMDEAEDAAKESVADHLYSVLRGTNNLVFPNSKTKVEFYADALRRRCAADGIPNEFWPHHGNLSRDLRHDTEAALKSGLSAATAVCTNTLELGVDIGAVKCVAQIGPAGSVAALRQRLGRSGRREGEPAILRGYCIESDLRSGSPLGDQLREGTVQAVAMIRLLLRNWFEPPPAGGLHLSTLVQQILSIIAERGGATAAELYGTLVVSGPFKGVMQEAFMEILRSMAAKDLLVQDSAGALLPGAVGEQHLASRDFYACFATDQEWSLICDGRTLGTVPLNNMIALHQTLLFGGRRWRVMAIDEARMILMVSPDAQGRPPAYQSERPSLHQRVREEMRAVLAGNDPVPFLDATAARLVEQARRSYRSLGLADRMMFKDGSTLWLMTWAGDDANDALVLMLGFRTAANEGIGISVDQVPLSALMTRLELIAKLPLAELPGLLTDTLALTKDKWDWALPETQLRASYISQRLDMAGAQVLAAQLSAYARAHQAALLPEDGSPPEPVVLSIELVHRARMQSRALEYRGVKERDASKPPRATHCWACKMPLSTASDLECVGCGWIVCGCGACGCR